MLNDGAGTEHDLFDERAIEREIVKHTAEHWQHFGPGEDVVAISGFDNQQRGYLCHTLNLHLNTGW